jgi:DNA-binding PadR family transcriptional regulator
MLQYILLGLVNYTALTGYEIKSIIDETTVHFWHAHHSQIYTLLRRMEADGLLTSEECEAGDKLNRRVYRLTEQGRRALEDWLAAPLLTLPAIKEDLLVRLFFSGQRPRDAVLDELRIQRTLHEQQLAFYRGIDRSRLPRRLEASDDMLAQHGLYWHLTLQFGIAYEEMYLKWIESAIAQIMAL